MARENKFVSSGRAKETPVGDLRAGNGSEQRVPGLGINFPQFGQRRNLAKVGRNDPCPCGSGLKHKKCQCRGRLESNRESWQGQIREYPHRIHDAGAEIHLEYRKFVHEQPDSAMSLDAPDIFEGLVLQLVLAKESSRDIEGTAVLVAPGVALAATHVLQPYVEQLKSGEIGLHCVGVREGEMTIWLVRDVTQILESDITILTLELATDFQEPLQLSLASLTTRTPAAGELVTVVGFRTPEPASLEDGAFTFGSTMILSHGRVTAVYAKPTGRDRLMLPWPCLEIDCPTWGGMSGGPAFDRNGFLVGLLCSSVGGVNELSGPSYISLLHKTLACSFPGGWPEHLVDGSAGLICTEKSKAAIEAPEAVQLKDGRYVHYPWSDVPPDLSSTLV